ncbi:uncharacterized protein LOC119732520 [Patiria miniata]|uniref:F-box domain-containing protein n=1 Tax=Patiria miniata TaxID=46514 RepID=A0A914AES1_PATMI|nr:uncharacterized protein LOC119732520 [Patiria miniata]
MDHCVGHWSSGSPTQVQDLSEVEDVVFIPDYLRGLPVEVTERILSYLSETDLCRLAVCSRGWRERTNRDRLWRPICLARGWERYGTAVDLNLDEGSLDHSHVLIGESTETLEPTCEWKAVFLKALDLEANWAKEPYCNITHWVPCLPIPSSSIFTLQDCDGDYFVYANLSGNILIWDLGPQLEEVPIDSVGDPTFHLRTKYRWKPQHLLVSKGVGLVVGCHTFQFVRTFDCRTGRWLAEVRTIRPILSSFHLNDTFVIGQPSMQADLSKFYVWGSANGKVCHKLRGHVTNIKDLALCGDMAASAAEDVILWDVSKGELLRSFQCPDGDHMFSDCKLSSKYLMGVYLLDGESSLAVWNLALGLQLTVDAGKELSVLEKKEMDCNEFAVVFGSTVWSLEGEAFLSGSKQLTIAGKWMLRKAESSMEVWSLGPDSSNWRRLHEMETELRKVEGVQVLWADDTKLVFRELFDHEYERSELNIGHLAPRVQGGRIILKEASPKVHVIYFW